MMLKKGFLVSKRPGHKELGRKLKTGKEVLFGEEVFYADPAKTVFELEKLGILETVKVLRELLDEINPENYVGGRPRKSPMSRPLREVSYLHLAGVVRNYRGGCT